MNRLTSGSVALLALLLVAGCKDDPTEALRGGVDHLVANPSQLFLEVGASKTVEVGAVDEQGNPLDFEYLVTATGNGITVKRDSTYLPIFIDDTTLTAPPTGARFRFIVTGTGYAATSFTVSAGGVEVDVPVQVIPEARLAATFSTTTPALGDTVTVTAPAGTSFSQTSALTFTGAPFAPLVVERDPAGAFIRFIPPPNVVAPLTISEVSAVATPAIVFTPETEDVLTSPFIDSVDVTYSTATPTLGQTVTVTITNPFIKFSGPVGLNFADTLPGPAAGPQNITVAPDSSSLTFDAPPNATGPGFVSSFVFPGGFAIPFFTRTGITAETIAPTVDATFDDPTPDVLQQVKLTAPAGFQFTADATVAIGGTDALIQAVAPDGSSIDLIPIPSSTGTALITGVSPSTATQFVLQMSTLQTITVPALTPLTGTDNPATAPDLTIPTAGNSSTLNDAGAFAGPGACCFGAPTRFYKLTILAPTTLTFTLDWFEGQDLGVYITEADALTVIDAGDSGFEGPTGHPETVTVVFAPGTYFAALPNFSTAPPSFFQLTLSNP